MNEEKLKETRMKIAYNVIQGLAADGVLDGTFELIPVTVLYAYQIADEILKQGGYDV